MSELTEEASEFGRWSFEAVAHALGHREPRLTADGSYTQPDRVDAGAICYALLNMIEVQARLIRAIEALEQQHARQAHRGPSGS